MAKENNLTEFNKSNHNKRHERSAKWKSLQQMNEIAYNYFVHTAVAAVVTLQTGEWVANESRNWNRNLKKKKQNLFQQKNRKKSIRVCNITNFELNQWQWYLLFEAQCKPLHNVLAPVLLRSVVRFICFAVFAGGF